MRARQLFPVALFAALIGQASAQNFGTQTSYDEELKKIRHLAPLNENLFGEQVNLQDGTTSFRQTDVSVTTKTGAKLEFGRISESRTTLNAFALGWGMDVPYMVGTYDTRGGWNTAGAGDQRCSTGKFAPNGQYLQFVTETTSLQTQQTTRSVSTSNIFSPAHVFWHGIEINIPSAGNEQLLEKNASQALPSDGKTYVGTTKSGWRIRCLPNVSNGTGEGFAVLLTNGTTYYFDRMVTVKVRDYIEWANGTGMFSNPRYSYQLPLANYFLLATKIVDRNGNIITYQYDDQNPGRLLAIHADDGTRLDFHYTSESPGTTGYDSTEPSITEIHAGTRKWTYSYLQSAVTPEAPTRVNLALQSITLPDGSNWKFEGPAHFASFSQRSDPFEAWKTIVASFWEYDFARNCQHNTHRLGQPITPNQEANYTTKMTHPSGAKGEFTFKYQFHGINNAPGQCHITQQPTPNNWTSIPGAYTSGVPDVYLTKSLTRKKISGEGLASDSTWDFTYNPSWSFAEKCQSSPGSCDDRSITSITSPDGSIERIEIGNDYATNYGKTLSRKIEVSGQILQQIDYDYLTSASGQSFPNNTGDIPLGTGVAEMYGNPHFFENRPLVRTTIYRDGATYHSEVEICSGTTYCFTTFAQPTKEKRSSSSGFLRTDGTEYENNLAVWVLGQIRRRYNVDTGGTTEFEAGYNTLAQPIWTKKFGKLQQTLTYNTDGTLATVADGRGNVTSLSNWKRGIPQLIRHPATPEAPVGATESATVNDNGWITSVTDENGYVTGYGYDAMGRLASVVRPTGDSVTYHNTLMNFRALTDADWKPPGVASGQWRLYEETGSRATITYMDALWRPVLKHEYDAANVGPTLRAVKTGYDSSGRVSFQSYPSSDMIPGASGIRTFYDALDRVTRVEQDSELGVLATTTEYLAGLKTRVTNPRGYQTTTSFMAWDQPGYDLPILSEQPEGKVIEIARHPQFGWPQQLKQRNTAGTLQQSRQYVYDTYGQLCKTIEPETGATVMDYDAAGNLSWSAAGLIGATYTGLNDCSQAAAGGSGRVTHRAYDARNRLTNLAFPNGRGNQVWSYTPDGLPASITTYNETGTATPVVNGYSYNRRRLMTGESIYQAGWYNWATGYGYDAYGHLSLQTYHTGLNVDYAPNVYGQPTKAGTFASGAQYYPNGALKQFTYGNGIVHTMTQNARQLPVRVTATGNAMDYDYAYDPNGNVERIYDYVTGTPTPRHRWMGYDGLDRLTSTASAVFGGTDNTHRFTYDALDNMTSWKLAGVKDYADYVYDASTHRLTNIRNTAGATVVGMDYDEQGNLRNKNGQAYEFDYGNRLRNVPGKESYRYDGHGRRVLSLKPDGSNLLSMYGFNGQVVLQDHGTKVEEHIYLAGSIVATRVKTWATGGTYSTRYQHTDALGSPVAVSNEAGQVIERNDYEPYGAIIGKPTFSGIGYTGHVMDGATGLTYMQQRYYDESVGRFLSVDPVTANSGTGANFNRFSYANNNPYRFADPDGRQSRETLNPPSTGTGVPFLDWLFKPSDVQATSKGQMISEQLASELSQPRSWRDIVSYIAIAMSAGAGAAGEGVAVNVTARGTGLADDALVVRAGSGAGKGANTIEGLANGTSTHPTAGVTGFSAESANGASLCVLCSNMPRHYNQVGVTTVGAVRAAGGDVISTPGVSPTHATVTGLSPETANRLLTPTISNPVPKPKEAP